MRRSDRFSTADADTSDVAKRGSEEMWTTLQDGSKSVVCIALRDLPMRRRLDLSLTCLRNMSE